ncbi:metallophosphoesterase [Geobacter pickeringii]|uniref:Metallophosphoesterase n=1 Tax=Geobacter pickeringii TaxID=345632 RepID=A0A0B5BBF0_9BACT|nr:metallophosphoesterase [Geobacter pickeringii]AJE04108.1 metallophosphoesterase [Geobacter pickeringii]
MSIFLATFFLVYCGTHLYFYTKARAAFGFGPAVGGALALFLALMAVAPILVRVAEREGFEEPARLLAWSGYCWMGFLFLFFSCSLLGDCWHLLLRVGELLSRGEFTHLRLPPGSAFGIAAAYALLAAAYGYHDALAIRTERLTIRTPKLPLGVEKLIIAQISDVHVGLIVREERLRRMLAAVRAADPDLLVCTGDLVDGQMDNIAPLMDLFAAIRPRYGKFAVSGNHEYYVGLGPALDFTRRAGFRVLRGEGASVAGVLNVVGVDDPAGKPFGEFRGADERSLLAALPRDRFTLLLKHRPRIDPAGLGLFDLQLSGHVHGGQLFPFGLAVRLSYPFMDGLHRLAGGALLFVSRGTGTWGPPIRFLAPPEVTVFELVRGDV